MTSNTIAPAFGSSVFLIIFIISLANPSWSAEMYRTVEKDGTIAFTNVPTQDRFKPVSQKRSPRMPRLAVGQLAPTVALHSRVNELDPALVWAVMKAESNFDPNAISSAGALGLMQLMPETATRLRVDPLNPEENIAGGARYLRYLLDRFHGNLPLALAAYNAGATTVESYRTLPPIAETQRYVRKVLRFYRKFAESLPGHPPRTSSSAWVDTLTLPHAAR
jgi:soluble lytic murein transglycosylase